MIRSLLVAALLVVGVAPAWAQSDTRWFAIFVPTGETSQGTDRMTGQGNKTGLARGFEELTRDFDRTGTPYRVFTLVDSAGGWARTMRATRPAGVADSTWFRQQGCAGWFTFVDEFSNGSGTAEICRYFTDASNANGGVAFRGVQRGSPASGDWGIPGCVLAQAAKTNSGLGGGGIFNGINNIAGTNGTNRARHAFANGDTISTLANYVFVTSTAEAANVFPIIYGADSLDGTGVSLVAWRYKTNCLYYTFSATNAQHFPLPILLAIADVFNRAGYTPRRKLNLHIDADHIFPDSNARRAGTDSLITYMEALNMRFSGPVESHSSELADDYSVTKELLRPYADRLKAHPHSHNFLNFAGVKGNGSPMWDRIAWSDTATKRQRWNFMEQQLSDTLLWSIPKGYERTATFPNNDAYYPDLYIMAQNGYRDIRVVAGTDSAGHLESINSGRKVRMPWSAFPITVNRYPFAYVEPISGVLMYVHDSFESPHSADSSLSASTPTEDLADGNGFADYWSAAIGRAISHDGAVYFHPDINLSGTAANPEGPMPFLMRRWTYIYGRIKNIVTIEPSYRNKVPRRHSSSTKSPTQRSLTAG